MAHESFEDDATAALMNERYVSIKVDREERPDIDAVYMEATQALTGRGGWPMTVFLDHDGRAFLAGTYFPPVAHGGMPSFTDVLRGVDRTWRGGPGASRRGRPPDPRRRSHVRFRLPTGLDPGPDSLGTSPPRWMPWLRSSTQRAGVSAARRSSRRRWCSSSCCAQTP